MTGARELHPRRAADRRTERRARQRLVHRVHDVLIDLGADILDAPAEYDYNPGYYAVFCREPTASSSKWSTFP